jgi:GTP cyclohydrolase IB
VNYKEMNVGLPDLQNESKDFVRKHIYKVGINNYAVPLKLFYPASNSTFSTIATVSAYAFLSEDKKGVNMSRFSQTITESIKDKITNEALSNVLRGLKSNLESETSHVKFRFNYLMKVFAPESKLESWFKIPVTIEGSIDKDNKIRKWLEVEINYTSCCPCSKEISEYGAHNQRSLTRIKVELINEKELINFEEFKEIVDKASSCPIYNTLKRVDEKYVTEKAFENPKFSEDTCREIAVQLDEWLDNKILDYVVVTENYESIHQSNALAIITAGRELN